ncbi:uncharacterized protein LOC122290977 [Carya illinoinensis]|uniref:uncharacterized protein LOC122290977 n=1 Tax=Carya illinoinensis TaxID=32201 RepID=UPI001C726497|nr:uncharacterized protein LOC122290977 [Carya illinoinensis]
MEEASKKYEATILLNHGYPIPRGKTHIYGNTLSGHGGGCKAAPPGVMKILSWNCRGLGNPQTVQYLGMLIKEKKPELVFLMETKLSYTKACRISKRFRFQGSNSWLLSCFYGHPVTSLRNKTWSLLSSFKPADGGWGVIGDFNEVLYSDEKVGGNPRSEYLMRQFREVMEEGSLCDLGPILLDFSIERCSFRRWHHFFKYEASWNYEEGCSEVVAEAWNKQMGERSRMEVLMGKLETTQRKLSQWSRNLSRERLEAIKEKTNQLDALQRNAGSETSREQKKLQVDLNLLLNQEYIKWKQMAKRHWLVEGDRNTKFYHACVNQRRKKNAIRRVKDLNGIELVEKEAIAEGFKTFFNSVYQSTQPDSTCINKCLQGIDLKVSNEMRSKLERNFTAKEIEVALKHMSPFKSPGPDGYSAGFYQEHWKTVGKDVSSAVLEFLSSGIMPWRLNHTHLVLIPKWTNLLMNCVRTVTYSTILNGIPGERGLIKGVAVSRKGTRINHLLFADDCAIFCRAQLVEWYQIKGLLKVYEEASGQTLNKEKTSVFFSSNTRVETKNFILQQINGSRCNNYNKYLGLPTIVGRSKYNTFQSLKEKVWRRVNSWKHRFLSTAGKEILIKSVLQAIPTYAMSVFKMPGKLLKDIKAIIAKFWWCQTEAGRGIHWKSWSSMGTVKNQGGLGFRDFNSFNRALLAKQLWRMIKEPQSLVSRVFKEKYFLNCEVMEAELKGSPSYIWRSIWSSRNLVREGLVWRVGNGRDISIWKEKWLPRPVTYQVQTPSPTLWIQTVR